MLTTYCKHEWRCSTVGWRRVSPSASLTSDRQRSPILRCVSPIFCPLPHCALAIPSHDRNHPRSHDAVTRPSSPPTRNSRSSDPRDRIRATTWDDASHRLQRPQIPMPPDRSDRSRRAPPTGPHGRMHSRSRRLSLSASALQSLAESDRNAH